MLTAVTVKRHPLDTNQSFTVVMTTVRQMWTVHTHAAWHESKWMWQFQASVNHLSTKQEWFSISARCSRVPFTNCKQKRRNRGAVWHNRTRGRLRCLCTKVASLFWKLWLAWPWGLRAARSRAVRKSLRFLCGAATRRTSSLRGNGKSCCCPQSPQFSATCCG